MSLLVDRDLLEAVKGEKPIVTGLPDTADWYSKNSPIQAASIDLHVGEIYLPVTTESESGKPTPRDEHILEPGETAVVTTAETISLPSQVGALRIPAHPSFW